MIFPRLSLGQVPPLNLLDVANTSPTPLKSQEKGAVAHASQFIQLSQNGGFSYLHNTALHSILKIRWFEHIAHTISPAPIG